MMALEFLPALSGYESPYRKHVRKANVSHKGTLRIAPAYIILP